MNLIEQDECVIIGNTEQKKDNLLSIGIIKEKKLSGIYKIINKINGKYYVGSSSNLLKRKKEHFNNLKSNRHDNNHLQKSWNKYGEDNFEFIIVENNIDERNLLLTEQKYLNISRLEKDKCYNMSFIAGKIEMTNEIKNKISKTFIEKYKHEKHPWTGKHHSKQSLQKISKSHIGIKNPNYGKRASLETRKKLSIIRSGKNHWNFGNRWDDEVKEKISKNHSNVSKDKNPRFDKTIYNFKNIITNEVFIGTRYDFYITHNLNRGCVCMLIKNKLNIHKNWSLNI